MPVYVDNYRARFRGMIMCHMVADTLDELHAMADGIGMARRWFQNKAGKPHYDIPLDLRERAIALGAIEINMRQAPAIARRCAQHAENGDA